MVGVPVTSWLRPGRFARTVWKAINALRKAGHHIEGRKSLGYRYAASAVLDADAISFYTHTQMPVTVLASVDSTQVYAKEAVNAGTRTLPFAVLADQQSGAYGRRGRHFYAPASSGLYLSMVLPNAGATLQNVGLLTTGVLMPWWMCWRPRSPGRILASSG